MKKMLFEDCIIKIPVSGKKIKQKNYLESGKFPVIDQGQEFIGGYTNDEISRIAVTQPVIVFGDHTRIIKFVNFDFAPGADGVKVFRPLSFLDPRYFAYILQAVRLPDKGYSRHYQYLEKLDIPIRPLPEQKRIVSKTDSLFSRLDSAKDSLVRVRQEIKRYRQAVLKSAFEGELTNAILRPQELGTLVEINLRNDLKNSLEVGFMPMKLIDVNFSGVHSFETRKWGRVKSGFTHIRNNDVLLAKITPCFENGKSAIVSGLPGGYGAATTEVFALTVNQAELLPKYLYLFLRQERIILEGKKLMTGAVGQKRIPRSYLESLLLPMGSLDEQREIVCDVELCFEKATVLEDAVNQGLERIEQLKHGILKKAFEGKLVEPDSDDEPVEVLLERIRKEKAKTVSGRTRQ